MKNKKIEDLIVDIKKIYNIDYDVIWKQAYQRYGKSHTLLANWNKNDFEGTIVNDVYYAFKQVGNDVLLVEDQNEKDVRKIIADDKLILQNYGRPYKDNKTPTGSYYKFAKKFEENEVKSW